MGENISLVNLKLQKDISKKIERLRTSLENCFVPHFSTDILFDFLQSIYLCVYSFFRMILFSFP